MSTVAMLVCAHTDMAHSAQYCVLCRNLKRIVDNKHSHKPSGTYPNLLSVKLGLLHNMESLYLHCHLWSPSKLIPESNLPAKIGNGIAEHGYPHSVLYASEKGT